MLEKFTEKAVNVIIEARNTASELGSSEVKPEHILIALVKQAKGISLKLFKMWNISEETLLNKLGIEYSNSIREREVPFGKECKEILKRTMDFAKKTGNENILFEHIFLVIITDKDPNIEELLSSFGFDFYQAREILTKLVQKKTKKLIHPEAEDEEEKNKACFESIYEGSELANILDTAAAKLSASHYEILGTEQILSAILEDKSSDLAKTFAQQGVTAESFIESLNKQQSRKSEFEDKKIIFTPNAFGVMNLALQIAKEYGSSVVRPEHVVLSILNAKKGLAYDVLKDLKINEEELIQDIVKPIEKQMPETLRVLRLAKEEARRIGRNIVGTEMFLLGIIAEGTGIGAAVLKELEITLKDARLVVENLVGFGNEYFDKEIIYTKRAKRVLEHAWLLAKKQNKSKIGSEDLLSAIIEEPSSLAMKVLAQLGVDAVEIKYGILNECSKNR